MAYRLTKSSARESLPPNTAGSSVRWEISESDTYALCVSQIGGALFIDRALAPILNGLSLNPMGFPEVPSTTIRIAKTRVAMKEGEIIPALTLRFRVTPPHSVELLHLEVSTPEEMEIDNDFRWD